MPLDPDQYEAERRRSMEAYEQGPKIIRASDADRDRAVAQLRQHLIDGRITAEEFSERVDQAFAARTTADIEHALRELPHVPYKGTTAPLPERAPVTDVATARTERRELAVHAATYLAVNALLILVWLVSLAAGRGTNGFWPLWVLLGWGIGLVAHAARVRGGRSG
ncbi:MAG TPA: DUF1707 domain-containing protein [Actinomycetes bacterium]|nr:DUF1707 domain-containing protein [Actinomycetes bacterium]